MLEEVYQRRPFCFQTLHFRQGTQQAVHSDTIHFNSEPSGFMCGVWIALEDIDENNGPLIYYPGSHKLPEITMADVGVPSNRDHYAAYENFIGSNLQRTGLPSQLGMIKKGQAIIWAANLLHGGSPIVDPRRTRFSQVSHYFFEGCKYYIPILSSESRKRYRNPVRIYSDHIVEPRRSLWSRLTRTLKSTRM